MNHNVVLKVRETVVDGFDKMPQALMGLFTGDNTGKMVVKAWANISTTNECGNCKYTKSENE